ncbi:hypothetical protein [Bradyrhizobium lablabi]|uniref:hypothetical protein n=1 Tax=Bradyrhizobium lablabi TaxID=722472 RepID=UPI001BADC45B|nr:hypothetical protein [Bradyrhizobium lablabi]MBR0697845.1 hypothetical protein [Bradyrhizobium lablabi]
MNLTLSGLRARLNRLDEGTILRISEHDYERLFGINHFAAARVAQFAKEHNCLTVPGTDAVYFRKQFDDPAIRPKPVDLDPHQGRDL